MVRPSRDEVCMEMARAVGQRGTCTRLQVGVVIAMEGRVLSTGYNGAPAGMPHCNHECNCDRRHAGVGIHADFCPAHDKNLCTISVHAEVNAVAFAARHGVAIGGADLYTTFSPCLNCALLLINSGLRQIFYGEDFYRKDGLELLERSGIDTWPMF